MIAAGSPAPAAVKVGSPHRIVLLTFDELPTTSLLDGNGKIDADLYPNFAKLAAGSTWYRNDTTVAPFTDAAMAADRSNLRIEVKYPSRSGRTEPTVLIVQVPTLADLEIETVSADIDVHACRPRGRRHWRVPGLREGRMICLRTSKRTCIR